ncbi:MAG: hypothetical protein JNJ58_12010 [Chitinophagaceae bacterium]|nr:hypothetical protein [Chitinophagaceae bacterium]
MKKISCFIVLHFLVILLWPILGSAQTPQYFNTDGVPAYNLIPLNPSVSGNQRKVQYLYPPNTFSSLGTGMGTPAPGGVITTVYFKVGFTVTPGASYSDFTIRIGQVAGIQSDFGSGPILNNYSYFTGLTTCFYASNYALNGIQADTWYPITLQNGFNYNPNLSLIIEFTNTNGIGNSVANVNNGTIRQRIWGPNNGSSTGSASSGILKTGINITPVIPCNAMPTPGNTLASSTTVCSGTQVTLSLQNPGNPGSNTFQWYNKLGIVAGATGSTYSQTINSADSFYCQVTCPNTSQSTYSNPVQVSMLPPTYCYCIPATTNGPGYGRIKRVRLFDLDDVHMVTQSPPYYVAKPDILGKSANLVKGSSYSLKVTTGTYSVLSAWFDWNQNGVFEVSEFQTIGTNPLFNVMDSTPVLNITVPTTALAGITKMRIRGSSYGDGLLNGGQACSTLPSGETADYFLHIQNLSTCVSNPTPPSIQSNVSGGMCIGQDLLLALNPIYQGSGSSFQWYKNNTPVSGATLPYLYTTVTGPDSFKCAVSCSGGPVVFSQTISLSMNPPLSCYCIPPSQYGCSGGDYISKVVLNTLNNNSGSFCNTSNLGYENYSNNMSLSTTLQRGQTYTMEVWPGPVYGQTFSVWMDFNDDGLFNQNTERLGYTAQIQGGGIGYISVIIPCWVSPGVHRMRVRCDYSTAGGGVNITPCDMQVFGETEDYSITISPNQNLNLCYSQLQLNCMIQGYMQNNTTMKPVLQNAGIPGAISTMTDTITVELREPVTMNLLRTKKGILSTTGVATLTFDYYNGPAWIVVKGRNSVPVWSASPQNFTPHANYNFKTAASQAYGNNQIQVSPGIWAMYSGDIDQSGGVDGDDHNLLFQDIISGSGGYLNTDIDGSGGVDGDDFNIFDPNVQAGVGAYVP